MVITKEVEGVVDYNDGEFAEVKTIGIEGIDEGLWLGTMQIHRPNTEDTPEEFRQRYPVGMLLEIVTTTEITPLSDSSDDLNTWPCETGQVQ
jgi:hypothetical protein